MREVLQYNTTTRKKLRGRTPERTIAEAETERVLWSYTLETSRHGGDEPEPESNMSTHNGDIERGNSQDP